MVVTTHMLLGDTIVSMTDSASDTFIRRFHETTNCFPCTVYDIWTGVYLGVTGIPNTVTIQYSNISADSQNLFFVSTYLNVAGFGNTTGTQGSSNQGSFQITTEKSGSWIVGGAMMAGQAGNSTCPNETPGPGLIQRISGCGIQEFPGIGINGDMEDNATALPNNTIFTYSEKWSNNNGAGVGFQMAAIELIATDKEPANPNFNNFCTTTNGLCVTSQYKLNYVRQTVLINSGTVSLASATAYCTGVTVSTGLVTTGGIIQVWTNYGGFDRNVTGATMLIQVYLTTVAPSTAFGVGLCSASGNTEISTGTIYFATSGTITAANAYSLGTNGYCTVCTANTWYAFVEITPLNLGTAGHLQFNQVNANANTMDNIAMLEIK
jgi:hypothetical protein